MYPRVRDARAHFAEVITHAQNGTPTIATGFASATTG
jgi:antitoxin (DNA-binding transcriptional repressor) of toxin-antitoxin stability system